MPRKPYSKPSADTHLLIREERVKAGLTQEQLAEALNTTPVTIGRYETGERGVTVEKLLEIAQALDVPPCRLIRDGDGLSAEERELIGHLRSNPKHRRVVHSTLQGLKDSES
ncbi:helix-turn-helix domain-containing protein [Hyphomonas sp.]|uniref:helix-turn-helix domain-containing protein n=1 Tax=Hyphomonas sp. TaxID=87 RepID=UPI00391BC4E8